ncbi:unnamed protein product [Toxocara canis]|uniref:Eyes absent homolog n=1 Tax=Toxocara canis TaxID=6265 RepID=A0A183UP23_TOXCA|nr:unnamed protein product [Toxocara canis]
METAVIGRQGSDTQKGPGNGQARQTRSERRAKRRAAFLASKTTLAEVAQTAIEPVERVDDLEDSNNALWTENTDSSFGHTRGRNSFIEESTDGYSNTPGLIDSSVADVSHAFEGYTSQLVTSSSNSKTAYSTSRPSNASFVSNKSTFATINNAATWEDLGSTVSALFNNAKKQNTESDSASSFLKKKASAAVVSLDEPPPPPPPISLSSSKPTKTTPTQYDHVSSSAVVTQYSGQPTKYSQPITTRVYNPTLSNYSSLNASEPLYTSTIGAENVFATTTVNHSSYDSAQPSLYVGAMQPIFVGAQLPLYGGLQQSSGYTSTPVAQSSQTGCYYNSYYPSFPSYSHF